MKYKRKISLMLSLVFVISSYLLAVDEKTFTQSLNSENIVNGYDKIWIEGADIYVYVKKGLDIPKNMIENIVNQSNKNGLIKIENYKKVNSKEKRYENRGKRKYIIRDYFVKFKYSNKKVITTVARGGKHILNNSINFEQKNFLKENIENDILSISKAKLSNTYGNGFKDSIPSGSVYEGPSENSNYNSKTYYSAIKTRVGYLKVKKSNEKKGKFKIVNYEVPLERIEWSVDNKIGF